MMCWHRVDDAVYQQLYRWVDVGMPARIGTYEGGHAYGPAVAIWRAWKAAPASRLQGAATTAGWYFCPFERYAPRVEPQWKPVLRSQGPFPSFKAAAHAWIAWDGAKRLGAPAGVR